MSAEVGSVKYRVELDDSGIDKQAQKTESKLASAFGNAAGAVGKAATTALKVGTAAVAAGTTAVVGLVKTATDAYGDFEQLTGGVETLFGDSAAKVMANAEQAFKSAGMSMNDYMETSIQSAAAMINSLGGDQAKAAELMDMSITDMADNVNKMGTSMEGVQNAYRGFSRGNFTMLDNLALGFAGTKEGMQELLDKAQELSGVKYDISSYSDIVEAIHVVQTEMGITGTTAKEAAETLQGSLGQMKAAWTNLTTGLADPKADIGKLIGDMIDSAQTFLGNLIPIVQQALTGIVTAIGQAAPMITSTFVPMFADLAPQIIDAGVQLVGALLQGIHDSMPDLFYAAYEIIESLLNSMIEATSSEGPGLLGECLVNMIGLFEENFIVWVELGAQLIENLLDGMSETLPKILMWVPDIVSQMARVIIENAPMLIESAAQLILTLALSISEMIPELIPTIVDVVLAIAEALIDNVDLLIDAAFAIIMALAEGVLAALPKLIEKAPVIIGKLVEAIIRNLPKVIACALELILALVKGLMDNLPKIFEAGDKILDEVARAIKEGWEKAKETGLQLVEHIKEGIEQLNPIEWGKDLIDGFISGLKQKWEDLKQTVSDIADSIKERLGFSEPEVGPLSDFHTYAPDMMDLYAKGITDNAYKVEDAVEGLAGDMAMGFDSDINYNVPDLAGYAADLSAAITGTGSSRIEVPVVLNGREIARASAVYMGEQLAWEAR